MFHWICPECGREIPPTVRECAVCDPRAVAEEPAPVDVVEASASAVESVLLPLQAALEATRPDDRASAVLTLEVPAAPLPSATAEPEPDPSIPPLTEMAVQLPLTVSDVAPRFVPERFQNEPEAVSFGSEAVPEIPATPVLVVSADPGAPLGVELPAAPADAVFEPASLTDRPGESAVREPKIESEKMEPEKVEIASPEVAVQAAAQMTGSSNGLLDLAAVVGVTNTPEPLPQTPAKAETDSSESREEAKASEARDGADLRPQDPELEAASVAGVTLEPAPVRESDPSAQEPVQATASIRASVLELPIALAAAPAPLALLAPPSSEPAIEPPAIHAAVEVPVPAAAPEPSALLEAVALLTAPVEAASPATPKPSPELALAPLQNYSPLANRPIYPVPPPPNILRSEASPRITLPGPKLPPQLESFRESDVVTVVDGRGRFGGSRLPGWVVSLLVALVPLGAGLGVAYSLLQHSSAGAQSASVETRTPPPAATPKASSPLAKSVEVTGFRILLDQTQEIHYLVVNHSAADLPDVTIYVTLRASSAQPGQPPLCRFSFQAPGLGPFESREITSSIEKITRSISLPDWQDLRADIEIAE